LHIQTFAHMYTHRHTPHGCLVTIPLVN